MGESDLMSKIRLEYISQAALGEPTLLASVDNRIASFRPRANAPLARSSTIRSHDRWVARYR